MAESYGGVVIDGLGRVLLREASGHFGRYIWSFPKGKANPGETAKQAALREVREETGVVAEIVATIPGGPFKGDTGTTTYFLMGPTNECSLPGDETSTVTWVGRLDLRDATRKGKEVDVDIDRARGMIARTPNDVGRERDLKVLDAAVELWRESVKPNLNRELAPRSK